MWYTAIAELRATGNFSDMDIQTDEDEHSLEMHLPYVRKVFEGSGMGVHAPELRLIVPVDWIYP